MKQRLSDRKWIAIIVFVLVLEILWLLADLQWLKIPFFTKAPVTSGEIEAGYVVKSKSDLKRRGGNSLVWEPAKEKDILYYKDSVLTLAQSTAKLYLNDKTELDLAENTLVTLEQPEDQSQAEIRLRFSRGDLKARNPNRKAKIEGEDWVVNLEKGAEVSLRKDKDNYEFEILSGRASLQTEKGVENLQDSKILKLGENKQIEQIEKNKELQWSDSKPQRLYTFGEEADVPVQWAGPAKQLQVSKAGETESSQDLKADQQSAKIKLQVGSYKLRLRDDGGLSSAKEIEIWKAPKIYPKAPLPRDRLSAGTEHEFVWSSEPGVKLYRVKISGNDGSKDGSTVSESSENFIKIRLPDENQDVTWSVEGVDEEGNSIPALQENRIFIRRDPLQPPKLKTPELREIEELAPATKPGAFHWWMLLMNRAHAAQTGYEVTFEWEPVEGAEHYTIEISADPEFKSPEVSSQTKEEKFKWHNFKPQKKYFWRVAAGSSRRMGVFSEPAEVKPVKAVKPTGQSPEEKAAAQAAKIAEQKALAETKAIAETKAAEEKAAEEKAAEAKAAAEAESARHELAVQKPLSFGFALMPTYKLVDIAVDSSSKANLGGVVPAGFQFEVQKNDWHFRLNATSQIWKAKPESDFPLQESLQIPEAWTFLNKGKWGVAIHQGFFAERKTVGSISTSPATNIGLRYAMGSEFGLSALTSGKQSELALDYEHKFYLSDPGGIRIFAGPGLHLFYIIEKNGNGSNTNLNILIGVDNF